MGFGGGWLGVVFDNGRRSGGRWFMIHLLWLSIFCFFTLNFGL